MQRPYLRLMPSTKILIEKPFTECFTYDAVCPHDNKHFDSEASWKKHHLRLHHENKWKCPLCGSMAASWHNYSYHVQIHLHNSVCPPPWICALPCPTTANKNSIKQESPSMRCCKRFGSKYQLLRHLKTEHGEYRVVCQNSTQPPWLTVSHKRRLDEAENGSGNDGETKATAKKRKLQPGHVHGVQKTVSIMPPPPLFNLSHPQFPALHTVMHVAALSKGSSQLMQPSMANVALQPSQVNLSKAHQRVNVNGSVNLNSFSDLDQPNSVYTLLGGTTATTTAATNLRGISNSAPPLSSVCAFDQFCSVPNRNVNFNPGNNSNSNANTPILVSLPPDQLSLLLSLLNNVNVTNFVNHFHANQVRQQTNIGVAGLPTSTPTAAPTLNINHHPQLNNSQHSLLPLSTSNVNPMSVPLAMPMSIFPVHRVPPLSVGNLTVQPSLTPVQNSTASPSSTVNSVQFTNQF